MPKNSISANAAGTFITNLGGTALGVLIGIVLAKTLGPTGKGVFSGVQIMLGMVTVLTGGAGFAITFFLTKERKSIGFVLPALGVVFAGATFLAWSAVTIAILRFGFSTVTVFFALVLPAGIFLSWRASYYTATGRLRSYNAQTIALSAGTLVTACVSLYIFRLGVTAVLIGWTLCTYISAGFFLFQILRAKQGQSPGPLRKVLRTLLVFGGQSGFNALLGVLNYRVDSLLLLSFLGFGTFGVYGIAVAVGELLFMLSRPVAMAISKDVGISDLRSSAVMTAKAIRLTTAIVATAGVISFLLAPSAIQLVYGVAFAGAALPLRILLPGIIAFSTVGIFVTFFLLQLGRPAFVTYYNIVMLVVQGAGCILLVPRFGMAGAAFSSSVTYVVGAVFNTWLFYRTTGIGAREVWLLRREDAARIYQAFKAQRNKPLRRPSSRKVIVVTGASADIAQKLRQSWEPDCTVRFTGKAANALSLTVLRRAARGSDTIVHIPRKGRVLETYNVFEAARQEGVTRVIIGEPDPLPNGALNGASVAQEVRTNAAQAAGTAFVQAISSLYADKYGLEVSSLDMDAIASPSSPHVNVANAVSALSAL
ncbi:MAG: polysaccharide biosynthesis C-terminal domain-containing protein [Candidatus Eremiobacteraeota bacterium]|nr:polysaccharide biosynthesis C-terminal domain-containing protein [Candidatus Eremiobacteraeota bacterium]